MAIRGARSPTGWERAWHGTKVEAVFSILSDMRLNASDHDLGGRTLRGVKGVYLHGDHLRRKAEGYTCAVDLIGGGIYFSAMFEALVDRSRKLDLAKHRTDQWILPEDAVELVALWVKVTTASTLSLGDSVQLVWEPEAEANPLRASDEWLVAAAEKAAELKWGLGDATEHGEDKEPSSRPH